MDLADRTLVVFCSDNGPVLDDGYQDGAIEKIGDHRAAGPFTGGKYSVYEGGTRTPLITRWKGRVTPGVSDQMVCTIDLAASAAALTGQTLPAAACLDSFNVLGALLGEQGAQGREHLVQQNNGNNGTYALRVGDWKLHRYDKKQAYNVIVESKLANTSVPQYQLFNLADDPGEQANVIKQHGDIAKRLRVQLSKIIESGQSRSD